MALHLAPMLYGVAEFDLEFPGTGQINNKVAMWDERIRVQISWQDPSREPKRL